MSSETPSSESSPSKPTGWDVFLSFRGVDTRYRFTSHLYAALDRHGIRTFMDDPQLRNGETISDALLQAIRESNTYVVVFSKNYAFSSWCLDELAEIFRCKIDKSRFVVPLFYHIDPSVVRRQTHKFDEAFEKHRRRFVGQEEKLRNWGLALEGVASLSGIQIPKTRSEVDVITQIVDQILLEINPKTIDVGRYPVGLFSRAEEVLAMLSSVTEGDIANGINGVITIGLHGIRGVGKTALAKTLYNNLFQHFQASCFLANVREISKTAKGMVSLQEQLLNDVLKCKNTNVDNVYHGVELIRARISFTKVLVVIDDLCNPEHYHLLVGRFPLGSLVIVTTRDVEVLDKIEVEPEYRYMVNELDDVESLKLFNLHAFRKPEPDNTLMVLTNHILLLAGGLPLALEVFGSYLYKRSEAEWKHYIKKLQHSIHEKY